MFCNPFQRFERTVNTAAEKLQFNWSAAAIFFIYAADLAYARIRAGFSIVVELTVRPFDLPAGYELVLCGRAICTDVSRAVAHLPARRLVSPKIGLFF